MMYIVVIGCVAVEHLKSVEWEAVTAVVVDTGEEDKEETERPAMDSDSKALSMSSRKPLTGWL